MSIRTHTGPVIDAPFNNLTTLYQSSLPFPGANFKGTLVDSFGGYSGHYALRARTQAASSAMRYLSDANGQQKIGYSGYAMLTVLSSKPACSDQGAQNGWYVELVRLAMLTLPYTSEEKAKPMLARLRSQLCDTPHALANRNMLDMMDAIAARDMRR